jgi:hypothetical protein
VELDLGFLGGCNAGILELLLLRSDVDHDRLCKLKLGFEIDLRLKMRERTCDQFVTGKARVSKTRRERNVQRDKRLT